jgi:hypothetical protein
MAEAPHPALPFALSRYLSLFLSITHFIFINIMERTV